MLKKRWKDIAIVGGVFIAYNLYELYRTGTELLVNYQRFKFKSIQTDGKGNISSASINVGFSIFNPTKGVISLRGVSGAIKYKGRTLGIINKGPFKIGQGTNFYDFTIVLSGDETLSLVKDALKTGLPVFEFELKYKLPFFSYTDRFQIPPKEYMDMTVNAILSFI